MLMSCLNTNFLKAVDEKFNPDKSVLLQVPPVRKFENNEMASKRINQFIVKKDFFQNMENLM